ncbi:MAG: hypothetical protein IPL29_03555 [Propionivibrio sp.]|nr:hypothetical protein [Propionivibrio sp.]
MTAISAAYWRANSGQDSENETVLLFCRCMYRSTRRLHIDRQWTKSKHFRRNTVGEKLSLVTGATCRLSNNKGAWFVTTPGSTTVQRSYEELGVTCEKEALEPGLASVKSTTKAMAFGNILFGGIIGAGVDTGTGAAYDYPSLITVIMGESHTIATPPRPVYPILFCRILQLRVRRLQLACHQQAHFQNPENPKQQLYADHSAHAFMTKAISCGRSTLRGLSIFFIQDGLA